MRGEAAAAAANSWQRERNKDLTNLTTTFRLTSNFHVDKVTTTGKNMGKKKNKL